MYNNPKCKSASRLRHDAIPNLNLFDGLESTKKTHDDGGSNTTQRLKGRSMNSTHNCKWKKKYTNLRKQNLQLHGKLRRLKNKLNKLSLHLNTKDTFNSETASTRNHIVLFEHELSEVAYNFIKTQKIYKNRRPNGMRWNDMDINLATSIHFKSPAAYTFLKTIFGLPCRTLIQTRLRNSLNSAGVCKNVIEALKLKFQSSSQAERMCVLSFDGMKINSGLHYTKDDNISGFEEINADTKTNTVATEMLLFMIRGLSSQWKQVKNAY